MGNSNVEIDVRNDGVYLVIDVPEGEKVKRMDVLAKVEAFGVVDIDFASVNEVFKSTESHIEKKISSNTNVNQKPETVKISISKDRLEAVAVFTPPVNNGPKMTVEQLKAAMAEASVTYGILNEALPKIIEKHEFNKAYLVARGKLPTNGIDGKIDYFVDVKPKDRKPKVLENGSVDFRSLNLIELVKMGQKLATVKPPILGEDGVSVKGEPIPFKPGKAAPPLVKGKLVSFTEDGKTLVADTSGQVLVQGNKLEVSPILEIPGDIDNNTGHVKFNGSIVIRGNVRSGFTVEAEGDVDITGVVEGAIIRAGSNVLLTSGIQGADKAEIYAGGDITTKFAESCKLFAGRNITADSIMHSKVKCDGQIELMGKNGLLVGGNITVGQKIIARTIGSPMATATEITVGNAPDKLDKYNELLAEYNEVMKNYDSMDKLAQKLMEMNKVEPLGENKKNVLLKALNSKIFYRENLVELQAKIDQLMPSLDASGGSIAAHSVIHAGVKVMIGNALLFVRDDIHNCVLTNVNGKIKIGSAV